MRDITVRWYLDGNLIEDIIVSTALSDQLLANLNSTIYSGTVSLTSGVELVANYTYAMQVKSIIKTYNASALSLAIRASSVAGSKLVTLADLKLVKESVESKIPTEYVKSIVVDETADTMIITAIK